ncbi:MAG: hypothetical protein J7L07_04475, partial [Candidatus Odinarchaeota archaeon]|nr:hypothetical protein [Candidatus Odinarchaeota archaeon]
YPLLYSADRTFFIIAGDFKVRKENLLKYVITLLERELKKIIINSNLSDTVLIDNDKKYGLVIDPFLLIHLDIDKVMEHAGNFYSSLSVRVKAPTKRSNEKKLRDTFSKLGVELDATYDVVLISRMLNFYYRIAGKAKEFRKIGKKSVEYQIKIWKYIVPESELNKYLKPGIKESEILSIVAGILYNCEMDGKLIKEFPAVEMFSIVGKVIANAIKELDSTDNIIEEYFKEQIGMKYEDYKKELAKKISDCIFLDYDLIEGVEELIASPEAYINSKVIGSSSTDFKKKYVCIMCNIGGFGFPLRTQRSGLATRIFTNRNIASKSLNVRWICAICLFECIFRAILFPEKIESNEKRVYLFLMPDVLFTRNLAGIVKRTVESKFGGESLSADLTRYSENIILSTGELEGIELFSRARRIGIRPFLTTDAHYIMFIFRYPPIENKSVPDSYIWYNSLYVALLLHEIFGGKYLITESFVPPSSGLIYSIKLEDPHSFIRRVLEFSLERKILDSGEISIAEIERIKKLLAGMCIIANTRYIERRGALHQIIPRVLKTFVDYCLPGSKYFAETLSLYATRGRDYQIRSNKSFIESCKILDITKGGKIIEW